MSVVTNVILLAAPLDGPSNTQLWAKLNSPAGAAYMVLPEGRTDVLHCCDEPGTPHDGFYAGHRRLEATVAIGAQNYLQLDGFIEFLRTLPWRCPEVVQLVVKEDQQCCFRLIDLFPERVQDRWS